MDVSFEEEFSFPFKAYDNQAKMAREVYRHLKASSDSFGDKKMAGRTKDVLFIESPTGTGKTITLLCAIHRYLKEFYATQQESALEVPVQKSVKFDTWLAEKESRYFESKQTAKTKELIKIKQELRDHIDLITNDVTSGTAFDDNQASRLKKIIFCSRTHSQLNQVLSEFKKLKCFNNFSLSIAGSRSKYCINTDVNGIKDHNHLNNQCRSLVREKSCKYYDEAAINQHKFSILNSIKDIEDIVNRNQNSQPICPFYILNESTRYADIILMTYNHLFNASKSLRFDIKDSIVIIDEAHNLENSLMSMFSVKISLEMLIDLGERCKAYTERYKSKMNPKSLSYIEKFVRIIYLITGSFKINDGKMLECSQFISSCKLLDFEVLDIIDFIYNYKLLRKIQNNYDKFYNFDEFLNFIEYIQRYYKQGIIIFTNNTISFHLTDIYDFMADMINDSAMSIMMAGTLLPLDFSFTRIKDNFDSSLLEFDHQIPDGNILVHVLPDNTIKYDTICDSMIMKLGENIHKLICKIPHGVVCFFQSFKIVERFISVWENSSNNLYAKISKEKQIFVEKRDNYEDYVKHIENDQSNRGGLFLAVCGGQLSEGINFKDNFARGVFLVGLPFANTQDKVKNYILDACIEKGVLKKKNEYFVDSCFKLVNQAIGRAFRHANDYACIVLLDSRYSKIQNIKLLSGWIRKHVNIANNIQDIEDSIDNFFMKFSGIFDDSF